MIYITEGLENGYMVLVEDGDFLDFEQVVNFPPVLFSPHAKSTYITMSNGQRESIAKARECCYFIAGEMRTNDRSGDLKGARRTTGNLISRSLVILDIDNNNEAPYLSIKDIVEPVKKALEPFSYYMYPSTNFTVEKPKYRLIIDIEDDMNKWDYIATLQAISSLIGIEYDKASEHWLQIMSLPCTDDLELFEQYSYVNYGEKFQVIAGEEPKNESLTTNYTGKVSNGYKGKTIQLLEQVIQGIPEGSRNIFFTRAYGTLIRANATPNIAIQLCRDWNKYYTHPPLNEKELAGIIRSVNSRELNKYK